MWEDIWICLQEPEAVLTVPHVLAHKMLTAPDNQESNTLAWVWTLVTYPSIDTKDWVHRVVTIVPKWDGIMPGNARLSFKYGDLVNAVTACLLVCFKQYPKQLTKESGAKRTWDKRIWSSQQIRDWQIDNIGPFLWVKVLNMPLFVWTLHLA